MYIMATWLTSFIGGYPKYPEAKDIERPLQRPWEFGGGVYNYNGTITLNQDTNVLGKALGVQPEEIQPLYYAASQLCSDTDGTSGDICMDEVVNPAVELKGKLLPVQPKDFNCNCGESGCSSDSMPCCANGSCVCHCNENGCSAEDPTCCYNGICAPLPGKLMPRFERMKRRPIEQ